MEDEDERCSFIFSHVFKKSYFSRSGEANEPFELLVGVSEHPQAQPLTSCVVGTNRSYLARKLLLLTHVVGEFQCWTTLVGNNYSPEN